MHYTLLLKTPTNARYSQSLHKLALHECACTLLSLGISASPCIETIGGASFLAFDADALNAKDWAILSSHSAVCFAATAEGELLRPLPLARNAYLPPELPHVLKYKGKTNVDFTLMMLHCAKAASGYARAEEPLTVLDPVCGRGTTLFCALLEGNSAIGVDADRKAIDEADDYFERFLQYNRLKHRREESSRTLKPSGSAKLRRFTFAGDAEAYKRGDTRTLTLCQADMSQSEGLLRPGCCQLIVGDLPYGVQHAPKEGARVSTQSTFLRRLLEPLPKALNAGGAIALSFNTYTLPREELSRLMREVGFDVLEAPPYDDFSHWVEQAINRDMVVARKA